MYACHLDLLRILHATLSVLDNADYPGKGTEELEDAKRSLRHAILSLELAIRSNAAQNAKREAALNAHR